jgi:hypothetical protein
MPEMKFINYYFDINEFGLCQDSLVLARSCRIDDQRGATYSVFPDNYGYPKLCWVEFFAAKSRLS